MSALFVTPWYQLAFGADYAVRYAHRDSAAAEREVAFASRMLPVVPGQRVMDLACGWGRHRDVLRRLGCEVIGLDLSAELLQKAAAGPAGSQGLARGDMRRLPFGPVFDHVLQLFTSFGYFDDADNERVLREIARVLRPGGRLFMDYLNPAQLKAALVAHSVETVGDWECESFREIRDGRVEKRAVWRRGGESREYFESVRLYEAEELRELLAAAGLSRLAGWGDFDGTPFTAASPRQLLMAERR